MDWESFCLGVVSAGVFVVSFFSTMAILLSLS